MNYAANLYPFRQDSTFLYFWAVNQPGLAALIDIDEDTDTLFGDEQSMDDVVWSGPLPSIAERAATADVSTVAPRGDLAGRVTAALAAGRTVHFLAPYRAEHREVLATLLDLDVSTLAVTRSEAFHKAVIAQRAHKSDEELADIESAVNVSREMYAVAMRTVGQQGHGTREYEVVAAVTAVAMSRGCRLSFPPICSVHGETLHNPYHRNPLTKGDVMILDSGVETPHHYASDITRTIPVGGTFSTQQRSLYEMVLRAQTASLAAMKPGVRYLDVHLLAARSFATDLKAAGLMRGDVDEAVAAGAHALFFPHGLGHMMGMDVHDLENLEERLVGYTPDLVRSTQFGLANLRLARELEPGFVVTVEPGLYFIPALIEQWRADQTHAAFLNFDEIAKYADARGYRIEDDVVVTETGVRVLGQPIPKTVEDVEAACRG